ncbi:MAG: flagellar export protein FliJ [Gammaproteobacteria bacterium]|nr:flagellar export protein FliJ [Gammaproteobacteria bacterium]
MTRSDRLEPIASLQRDKEIKATQVLGESQRRYLAQERRLADLEQFQREYQQRFQSLGRSGATIDRFKEYRHFNERLNDAIQQQKKLVEECRHELEQKNRYWSEVRSKRSALDKVIDRFRCEETSLARRREQRESDDRAQRMRPLIDGEG